MYRICLSLAVALTVLFSGQAFATLYDIAPTDDSWTYQYAADTNYGASTGMATAIQYMSPRAYTYLNFTLPDLNGETLQSATLYLYQYDGGGYGQGPTAVMFFSNNNWSENTLTWNNTPAGTLTFLAANANGGSYRGWSSWAFTWDQSHGSVFTLVLGENSSGDQSHGWYTKEYSDDITLRPYLELSTVPANPVPVPPTCLLLLPGFAGILALRRRLKS